MSVAPEKTEGFKGLTARLFDYIRPYRRWMLAALLMIVFFTLTINYLPLLIRNATDNYIDAADSGLADAARITGLYRVGAVYIAVALAGFLMRYGQGLLIAWIGQLVIKDLRADVFARALRLDIAFFDRTPVGRLMTRVTSDIDRLQRFVTEGVVGTVADIFMLFGILGYMVYMSPPLALVIFLLLPPLFYVLLKINGRLRQSYRDIRHQQSALNALTQEYISGMGTIQIFNREDSSRADFEQRADQLRAAHYSEVRWFSTYFPVIEFGQALSLALVFAIGGILIVRGSTLVSVGTLIAFITYIREFFHPLGSLSDKANTYQEAMASCERIFALIDQPQTVGIPAQPAAPELIRGAIEFRNVGFAYDAENWVLHDLSFRVAEGESVAIVGATGAGKTTIINLIGRFYDIQRGAITINGRSISEFRKEDLRDKIGFVFQEPFIFSGSVADNISMHDQSMSRAEIEAAARAVNAHDFIAAMPRGYDTVLKERGGGLSLGEKQLISMARVFVRQPELLLILDEATASVDSGTELLIQDALKTLQQGRTSIIIAHRLSTIKNADRILAMKHGRLEASGTHAELMAERGYYYQLYQLLSHHLE
jgi:ATP-binding cassette, subfamily B, multidrug efflux pump